MNENLVTPALWASGGIGFLGARIAVTGTVLSGRTWAFAAAVRARRWAAAMCNGRMGSNLARSGGVANGWRESFRWVGLAIGVISAIGLAIGVISAIGLAIG